MRFLYIHMHSIAKCTLFFGCTHECALKISMRERVRFSKFEKLCDILQRVGQHFLLLVLNFLYSSFLFLYIFFICCSSKSIRYAISCIMIVWQQLHYQHQQQQVDAPAWCQWLWLTAGRHCSWTELRWQALSGSSFKRRVSEFVAIHECVNFLGVFSEICNYK